MGSLHFTSTEEMSSWDKIFEIYSPLQPKTPITNKFAVKSFGSITHAVRNKTHTPNGGKQVWLYYGTGDITRPMVKSKMGNYIIGFKHEKSNAELFNLSGLNDASSLTGQECFYQNDSSIYQLAGKCKEKDGNGWYIKLPEGKQVVGTPLYVTGLDRLYVTIYNPAPKINPSDSNLEFYFYKNDKSAKSLSPDKFSFTIANANNKTIEIPYENSFESHGDSSNGWMKLI